MRGGGSVAGEPGTRFHRNGSGESEWCLWLEMLSEQVFYTVKAVDWAARSENADNSGSRAVTDRIRGARTSLRICEMFIGSPSMVSLV